MSKTESSKLIAKYIFNEFIQIQGARDWEIFFIVWAGFTGSLCLFICSFVDFLEFLDVCFGRNMWRRGWKDDLLHMVHTVPLGK